MRWSVGPIGIKDFFTLINLIGGVAAIYYLQDGRPTHAGVALMAGYLLGDTLDGVVARATRTSNRFGAELDSVTDHLTQAIVPAIIVYAVYAAAGHRALGFFLMAVLITSGTVRHALFSVAKLNLPLMYCGLPRTISGYASMSFVLSRVFFRDARFGIEIGAVLIPVLAAAGLLPIPYMTHRGTRRMQTYVRALVLGFLVMPLVAFFVLRDFTFDVLFVYTFGYALFGWAPLRPDERKGFFDRYRQWTAEVSH